MEPAGLGDAGHRKIMQLLLTGADILYTIIRGEKIAGIVSVCLSHPTQTRLCTA